MIKEDIPTSPESTFSLFQGSSHHQALYTKYAPMKSHKITEFEDFGFCVALAFHPQWGLSSLGRFTCSFRLYG
jgi:hypothetical protein